MATTQALGQRLLGWLWPDQGWPPLLVPIAVLILQVVGTTFAAENQPERDSLDVLGYLLLVAGPLALMARDRDPVISLAAIVGVTLTYLVLEYPFGPVVLGPIVALFVAVNSGHRLAAWLGAGAIYFGHFGAMLVFDLQETVTLGALLGVGAWLLLIIAASEIVRAKRQSMIEAHRVREEEARTRESEERLRIARELHDVLAHHISLINVQAGVGLHLMERKPEQARTALEAIETASRDALSELRSVLNILQRSDESAPRAPSPSLSRLESLRSQAKAGGLDVETTIEGTPHVLPAPIDAAAYRIIQESLTNVVRHAGAAHAWVTIRYAGDELGIEIKDDGKKHPSAPAETAGGRGLVGMRERVQALGGHFEAGALPQQGFRVSAVIPMGGSL
jgi:signal transduction histidine kinase